MVLGMVLVVSQAAIADASAIYQQPCYKVIPHLSHLAAKHGSALKIISINNDDILGEMPPTDIPALVLARDDVHYPIGMDAEKTIYGALYHPAGRLAIPTGELVACVLGALPAERTFSHPHYARGPDCTIRRHCDPRKIGRSVGKVALSF